MTDPTNPTPDAPKDPVTESPSQQVNQTHAAKPVVEKPQVEAVTDAVSSADSASDVESAPVPDESVLEAVASGAYYDPHSVLGQHSAGARTVIRVLRPLASTVTAVLSTGEEVELEHLYGGIWAGSHSYGFADYRVRATYENGSPWTSDDPYRFPPTIGELDLHLIGEGRHEELWQALGARLTTQASFGDPVVGTAFTVWAPHARAVRVIGDFNGWYGPSHSMRNMGPTGVWEIFVPEVAAGAKYKFEILGANGEWVRRADPMARFTETPPLTASVVGESTHTWSDSEWLEHRASNNPHNGPMSIYEMHLGSWRPGHGYRDLADPLIEYLRALNYTHVEFMPLAEHPYGGSWGYQISGYYAPTNRFGHPDDLKYLIDRLHQAGIGVLMDWVPGHFATDEWALGRFDGQALYEHPDPRLGEHKDWGTYIFNFGNSQVRNFLVANALYWLEEFHVDGLRVDAVASMLYLDYSREEGQWVPNEHGGRENLQAISLLQEANATAYKRNPGVVMIAEESTSWPGVTKATSGGGLGFGIKWNMGWMNDTLQYMQQDPMYRTHHHGELTFTFVYAFSENFLLPISHDEVVHGKGSLLSRMPGDHWQKLANVRVFLAFMWAHPGKQLLFMGQEFGQPSEWSEARGLDWWILDQPAHQGLFNLVGQLNAVYKENPALWALDNDPSGFELIDGGDAENSVLSFLRRDNEGNTIAVLLNFSGVALNSHRIALPEAGEWEELLNTDAAHYGGSGVGNMGSVTATDVAWGGRPASAEVTLPPLGSIWLRLRR
ncbi:1,4-alpha-glucan branching protein GlgB [Mycetocola zhadangensis]|uniref:1,4-alpha-glucan branching enzyme GlgB n=1 Tax=Mycetocola zhadangensis TaxID=1164595 RepID=A0A3L7J5H1_9MICO|nr:1,4-alpha-glucan branching protein GlgB [Mycetocola zhadangensis]RLQ85887.1 1,4-alpha-glucan branching protein GlgB [Mycetocola zhadangensis]GGE86685.1 1,4-alpha-glucan branching enzyme GlgB [Mycetocola zhadangensis]